MPRYYEYRHRVCFEETNVVGNVYWVNHLRWQGRCREMFLRDHAPDILRAIEKGLYLATLRVSCDYLSELAAFDEVVVRMRLGEVRQNRVLFRFEYFRARGEGGDGGEGGEEELIARGEQEIACLQRQEDGGLVPVAVPESMAAALRAYAS